MIFPLFLVASRIIVYIIEYITVSGIAHIAILVQFDALLILYSLIHGHCGTYTVHIIFIFVLHLVISPQLL